MDMFRHLSDMARKGSLRPPKHELVPLDNYQDVMAKVSDTSRFHDAKVIFTF